MSQNFSGTRNIILFLLVAAILLLLVYTSSNSDLKKQETIRIGITQWPAFEYLFVTKKQGFFKQAGIDIELVELSSLAEVRRAFERGKVDGMTTTLVEVLEAYKYSGQVAQPILVTDYSKGADEILACEPIKAIKDLKGKKIGVEAGSMSAYLVKFALDANNIDYSEVVIMPMEAHKLSSALKSGKVDAITTYPPRSIAIKKQQDVNVIFDSSAIPQKMLDVIALNQKILEKNPNFQIQFIKAWGLTLDYAHKHPEDAYNTLTDRIPISIDEFKQSMKLIHLVNADEQVEYFNQNDVVKNNLIETGSIVFEDSDIKDIEYSKFIYNKNIH